MVQKETASDRYTAASGLASAIGEAVKQYGVDVDPLYAALDIDPAVFQDLTGRVSLDRLCRLLETCALITKDEARIEMTLHHYPGHQVGLASCGKVNEAATKRSIFMWTHIHMTEAEAKLATRKSVEAELGRRAERWRPELRSKYELYTTDADAILAYGPVYNGKPPSRWYSKRTILIGDAAHPYGPGGQGISMALKDARALSAVIARGATEEDKREFQRTRAQESRVLGEAAEKRNSKVSSSTPWGVFAEGVAMKAVQIVTRGKLKV